MSETYDRLKARLEDQDWPSVYLFKFIVPNQSDLVARTTALFDDGTDLSYQPSKNGKYVSVSAREFMLNPDSVIQRYVEAGKIEGLIAL